MVIHRLWSFCDADLPFPASLIYTTLLMAQGNIMWGRWRWIWSFVPYRSLASLACGSLRLSNENNFVGRVRLNWGFDINVIPLLWHITGRIFLSLADALPFIVFLSCIIGNHCTNHPLNWHFVRFDITREHAKVMHYRQGMSTNSAFLVTLAVDAG